MLCPLQKKDFVVAKREFACVVKTPFEQAFSMANIKADFTKCGIHPFDQSAIDQSKIVQSPYCSNSSSNESRESLAASTNPTTSGTSSVEC